MQDDKKQVAEPEEELKPELEETPEEETQNPIEEEGGGGEKGAKEEPSKPVFEVVANTKEEKQALERIIQINKHVNQLLAENTDFVYKAEKYESLSSTLNYEPFVEFKNLICASLLENVEHQNIKEIEARTKDYKAIDNVEKLLKDFRDKASSFRSNFVRNSEKIEELEKERNELDERLKCAQAKIF